jgi:hypothetical protein
LPDGTGCGSVVRLALDGAGCGSIVPLAFDGTGCDSSPEAAPDAASVLVEVSAVR